MRNTLRMLGVLTIIGFISGASLVLIYAYASPLIKNNQEKETKSAIFKIFPEAKKVNTVKLKEESIFKAENANGILLGYAFLAEGNGYQGKIKIMAGIKPDLETLTGIEILESQETPGLGQEIARDKFKTQFKNLKTKPAITCLKNKFPEKPGEIQAITGATVSSSAVVSILNEKIGKIRDEMRRLQ